MRRRLLLALLVVSLATAPIVVAAETRSGGRVVVGPDERVDRLVTTAGTVVIEGTVDGDLRAYAGSVTIAESGRVTGDVEGSAGSVTVRGTVEGDLRVAAGSVTVGEGATVGESIGVGAGSVSIDGAVGGNAKVAAGSITVGPTASIGGSLTYDGVLSAADGATIEGRTVRSDSLSPGTGPLAAIPWWAVNGYWFLANLVAGGVLLLAFPNGSVRVRDRIDRPLRAGGAGIAAVAGGVLLAALLAVTAIGLPVGAVLAAGLVVLLWVGGLYARYAVGGWLLDRADIDAGERLAPFLLGFAVTGIAGALPFVGPVVRAALALVGGGAVAWVLGDAYRNAERAETAGDPGRL